MVGEVTSNLRLNKPDFNLPLWHDDLNDNFEIIDAAITTYLTITGIQGVWENSTAYSVGDKTIDTTTSTVYECAVAHTSAASPTLFAADRVANPSYWRAPSIAARGLDNWVPATVYQPNDFVIGTGNIFAVCIAAHTSSAVFASDAVYWDYLLNLSTIQSLPSLVGHSLEHLRVNVGETQGEWITTATLFAQLGLSTMATQSAAGINVTGGVITGLTSIGSVTGAFTGAVTIIDPATAGTLLTVRGTDVGAGGGPVIVFQRDSATPAASDLLADLVFQGRDSANNFTNYAYLIAAILDPVDGSEDGQLSIRGQVAGVDSLFAQFSGAGASIPEPLTINTAVSSTVLALQYADDTAALGPNVQLFRNSASPAISDVLAHLQVLGKDSGGNNNQYAAIYGTIVDPTDTTEQGEINLSPMVAGSASAGIKISDGVKVGAATTYKGVGTLNALNGLYQANGHPVGEAITFSAHKNGTAQTGIVSTVDTKLTFGTEEWDIGSAFASSTWTPPAGKYQIAASCRWQATNGVDNELLSIMIFKNGAAYKQVTVTRGGATGNDSCHITANVDANGTDTFEIYVNKNGAGNGDVVGTSTLTWFQGSAL